MLSDYLRSFWRGVLRNKISTLINIGGLALGLAVFFALSFYVEREFSWDAHWEGADRIYRAMAVAEGTTGGGAPFIIDIAPYVMGTELQARNPDAFEVYARVFNTQNTLIVDGVEHPDQQRYHAEPTFPALLQFETLEGSLQAVFSDPRSIGISAPEARRLFGAESPLGKTLTFVPDSGVAVDFVIQAVYRLPAPTTLDMPFLALLEPATMEQFTRRLDMWMPPPQARQPGQNLAAPPAQPLFVKHYFKLREGVDFAAIQTDLRALMELHGPQFGTQPLNYMFQRLRDAHLTPSPLDPTGDNVLRLWVYAAIGALVLLISGCNFVMLATLRQADRMRDVGIRKTVGGEAAHLMQQYLVDAFCHTIVAGCLAVVLLELALPWLQTLLQLPAELDLLSWGNLAPGLLTVVVFTLLSSAWPAWVTSRGKPVSLLRDGGSAIVGSSNALRRLLVGIQFAIVVVLLLATLVLRSQIDYTRNRDRGYDVDRVIGMRAMSFTTITKVPALLAEFGNVPGVLAASSGAVAPGTSLFGIPNPVKTTGTDGTVMETGLQRVSAGAGYFNVLSIPVLAGREFATELEGTVSTIDAATANVLLNEAAARALGFTNPEVAVGQLLETEVTLRDGQVRAQSLRVIGVVADTQFTSVMLPPVPQLYFYAPASPFLAVRVADGANLAAVSAALKTVWDRIVVDTVYEPVIAEALTGTDLRREEFEARIVTGATLLAVVIALLGLNGLVGATVLKRVKEIGVRKVMGATRAMIVRLFLWQFTKPIGVASLLAWPVGYWVVRQWLQRFPYQLDTAQIVVSGAVATLVALLFAWLTVGVITAKAASMKPVLALRYE